jgi:hypothetical protein
MPSDCVKRRDLINAHQNFSQALEYLQYDPFTPPKQVSRLCQKLMETSIRLSMVSHEIAEKRQYADKARDYAESSLSNAQRSGDECIIAQAEFMMACVQVLRVYVATKENRLDSSTLYARREVAEVQLEQRLMGLRRFAHLDMEVYEGQANQYMAYIRSR